MAASRSVILWDGTSWIPRSFWHALSSSLVAVSTSSVVTWHSVNWVIDSQLHATAWYVRPTFGESLVQTPLRQEPVDLGPWVWHKTNCRLCTCRCQLVQGNEECVHLGHRIFRWSTTLSTLKRWTWHSVFFLSQHVGLLTSSAAKHPEIIAIRYQLNLMELSRKLKTRRQYRGQPCTSNTDNKAEWRVHDCMDKERFVPTWWHL